MADSGEGWCESCLIFCCPCCYDHSDEKYSNVKYSSPAGVQADPAPYKMPIKKMTYEFSQPPAEIPVPPQMARNKRGGGAAVLKVADVVATQPRLHAPKMSSPRASRESSPVVDPSVPSTFPTIQYSLYYDMQRNILAVHLQQIFNLPIRRKTKNLDSMVTLYLTPHKEEVFESKVVQRSLNPLFSQQFEFTGQPGLELTKKQVLIFKIFEHGKYGHGELLGVVPVKLEEADLFGETTRTRIQESSTDTTKLESVGDILLSLTFLPETDTLNGLLLKASNLQQQDITGTADPYVKISLHHKGKSVQKWKSSIKKNTLSPVFNESFHFSIYNMDTTEMHLNVILMDYDRFSRDDVVGMVQIGADIPDGRGRTHWEEVMSGCNEPISRWHQVLPK